MVGLSSAAKAFVPLGATEAPPPDKKVKASPGWTLDAKVFVPRGQVAAEPETKVSSTFNFNPSAQEFPAPGATKKMNADAKEFKPPPSYVSTKPVSALNFAEYSSDDNSDEDCKSQVERASDSESEIPLVVRKSIQASKKEADVEDDEPPSSAPQQISATKTAAPSEEKTMNADAPAFKPPFAFFKTNPVSALNFEGYSTDDNSDDDELVLKQKSHAGAQSTTKMHHSADSSESEGPPAVKSPQASEASVDVEDNDLPSAAEEAGEASDAAAAEAADLLQTAELEAATAELEAAEMELAALEAAAAAAEAAAAQALAKQQAAEPAALSSDAFPSLGDTSKAQEPKVAVWSAAKASASNAQTANELLPAAKDSASTAKDETVATAKVSLPKQNDSQMVIHEEEKVLTKAPEAKVDEPAIAKASTPKRKEQEVPPKTNSESFPALGRSSVAVARWPKVKQQEAVVAKASEVPKGTKKTVMQKTSWGSKSQDAEAKAASESKEDQSKTQAVEMGVETEMSAGKEKHATSADECTQDISVATVPMENAKPPSPVKAPAEIANTIKIPEREAATKSVEEEKASKELGHEDEKLRPGRWIMEETKAPADVEISDKGTFPMLGSNSFPALGGAKQKVGGTPKASKLKSTAKAVEVLEKALPKPEEVKEKAKESAAQLEETITEAVPQNKKKADEIKAKSEETPNEQSLPNKISTPKVAASAPPALTPDVFPSLGGNARKLKASARAKEQEGEEKAGSASTKALVFKSEETPAKAKHEIPVDAFASASDTQKAAELTPTASTSTSKEETPANTKASTPEQNDSERVIQRDEKAIAEKPKAKGDQPAFAKASTPKRKEQEAPPKINSKSFPALGSGAAVATVQRPKVKKQGAANAKASETKDAEAPKEDQSTAQALEMSVEGEMSAANAETAVSADECAEESSMTAILMEDIEPSSPAGATEDITKTTRTPEAKAATESSEEKALKSSDHEEEKQRPARWVKEETKEYTDVEIPDEDTFPVLGGNSFPSLGGEFFAPAKKKVGGTPKASKLKPTTNAAETIEEVETKPEEAPKKAKETLAQLEKVSREANNAQANPTEMKMVAEGKNTKSSSKQIEEKQKTKNAGAKFAQAPKEDQSKALALKIGVEGEMPAAKGKTAVSADACAENSSVAFMLMENAESESPARANKDVTNTTKTPELKVATKSPEGKEKPSKASEQQGQKQRPARWVKEMTKASGDVEIPDEETFPVLGGNSFPSLGGEFFAPAKKKIGGTPKASKLKPTTKAAETIEKAETKPEEVAKTAKVAPAQLEKVSKEASPQADVAKAKALDMKIIAEGKNAETSPKHVAEKPREQTSLEKTNKVEDAKPWRKMPTVTADDLTAASNVQDSSKPQHNIRELETKAEDKPRPWRKGLEIKNEGKLQEPKEATEQVKNVAEQKHKEETEVRAQIEVEQKATAEANIWAAAEADKKKINQTGDDDKSLESILNVSASDLSTVAPSSHDSEKDDDASDEIEEEQRRKVDSKSKSQIVSPKNNGKGGLTGSLVGSLTGTLSSLSPGSRLGPSKPIAPVRGGITVNEMMRWHFAAKAEKLRDETVTWSADFVSPSLTRQKSETPTSSSGAKVDFDDEVGDWREDAAKEQKSRSQQQGKGNRSGRNGERGDRNDKRREEPAPALEQSETSWAARQKQLKDELARKGETEKSDAEVIRSMKSILNKLTLEKYDTLYKQMLSCGMSKVEHVQYLVHEIMEKATTQHHFIDMYAQLCQHLHEWFVENAISEDPKNGFKRILLNECQNSFEKYLKPIDYTGLSGDDLQEAQDKFKLTMLGNIKFVGSLLVKRMLASSVLVAVAEDLISEPTSPEGLECLALFLSTVGGSFDRPDWAHHQRFAEVIHKLKKKSKDKNTKTRVRFLLQDVLDLRSTGWEDQKKATKKLEGPSKLDEVKEKADAEESAKNRQAPTSSGGFSAVTSRRPKEDKRAWDDDTL